ncbi:MAG: PAS domain S-box protein [Bacteroidia bacterium]|nr:PAS domain S-box protein [Bacteroidia bacterium]MDW8089135.1 PAS domain S-box protein [Bacteroidia bacterium]
MARAMEVVLAAMRPERRAGPLSFKRGLLIFIAAIGLVALLGFLGTLFWLPYLPGYILGFLWLSVGAGGIFWGWQLWQKVVRYKEVVELQAREEILRVEGRYKALVQYASDVFLILSPTGQILYASPSIQRTLGYSSAQVAGFRLRELLHPEDQPLVEGAFSRQSSAFFTVRLQHREGYWRFFEGIGQPLFTDPIIQGYLLTLRDVTDRKREEEQRREREAAALRLAIERERAEYEKSLVEQSRRKLEEAYKIIESKNHEIEESLQYAARIQSGMAASIEVIRQYFPESFIFWRPRDVVSGDFYWFLALEEKCYLGVADCTGHGVPGALMTMISSSVLTQAVLGEGLRSPDEILSRAHKLLRRALRQDVPGAKSQDGMDIALICVDLATRQVLYAGANRPLWVARPDASEVEEYAADRKGIGGASASPEQVFTLHVIDPTPGSWFYMSSDGFIDQFGGPQGKKYMSKRFKQLLLRLSSLSAEGQAKALEAELLSWQGNLPQTDDIIVGGIRL